MRDSQEIIDDFCSSLKREYDGENHFLNSEELKIFRKYYGPLKNRIRQHLYERLYSSRLGYISNLLPTLKRPLILDAGCGLGSESILFSIFGANVLGVDLNKERLKIAEKRKIFYKDLMRGKVEFIPANVFEVIKETKFDVVWMNESISHIHPAEQFLELLYERLNPGGRVIISEGNGSNLYLLVKRFLKTGHWSWKSRFVQETGRGCKVGYAVERLFSIGEIAKVLKDAGYAVGYIEFTYFIPNLSSIGHKVSKGTERFERWLERKKFARMVALSYRIEGKLR